MNLNLPLMLQSAITWVVQFATAPNLTLLLIIIVTYNFFRQTRKSWLDVLAFVAAVWLLFLMIKARGWI